MNMVFYCPAAILTEANKLVELIDPSYGPENFSIPLSANGQEPATHYGGNLAGGPSSDFLALLQAAGTGTIPDEIKALKDVIGIDPLLVFKEFKVELGKSFDQVLSENNLQKITPDEI